MTTEAVNRSSSNSDYESTLPTRNLNQDKNLFLKLLTTQLANQDPNNAVDQSEMLSTLSMMSQMEGINNLNEKIGSLNQTASLSLIGHEITAATPDGKEVTGLVSEIGYDGKGTVVTINGQKLPASFITRVSIPSV